MKKRSTKNVGRVAKRRLGRESVMVATPKHRGRNSLGLTEDEADAIVCLRRMNQKEHSLEEAMERLGHAVDRPLQK